MSLAQQMAADMALSFLNTDDFAEMVRLQFGEAIAAEDVVACFGSAPKAILMAAAMSGETEARLSSVLFSRATVDAQAAASISPGRTLQRGDLIIASSASDYAGEWIVDHVLPVAMGSGLMAVARWDRLVSSNRRRDQP